MSGDPLMDAAVLESSRRLGPMIAVHLASVKHVPQLSAEGVKQVEDQWRDAYDALLRSVRKLSKATVVSAKLTLAGVQPIPKVTVRYPDGKKQVLEPGHLLLGSVMAGEFQNMWAHNYPTAVLRGLGHLFDAVLAPVRADVANAVSKAMADERVTGPIKERLAKKHALERAQMIQSLKDSFRAAQRTLTKEEVMQAWDETVCSAVMES